MTQFENSEIMVKYAELMEDNLVKTAWTWRDVVTDLGIEAAAIAAGAALFGPPGWIAILGGTALTLGLFYLTKQMDDNIDDLVDRLEDLDPNEQAVAKVNGWIEKFKSFKSVMQMAPTTTDPQERSRSNMQKYMGMRELHTYLARVQSEWDGVVPSLEDRVFDIGQAKYAIDNTLKAVTQALEKSKQYALQSSKEEIKKLQETTGIDYTKLANDILALNDKLTQIGGKPPVFEGNEKGAWLLAQTIAGKAKERVSVTRQDLEIGTPMMQDLKSKMEQGIIQLQTPKTSSTHLISKRALIVGDNIKVVMPGQEGVAGKVKPKRRPSPRSPAVEKLQAIINKFNQFNKTGAGIIKEDGIYGPLTAGALAGIVSSAWTDTVNNIKLMRSRPDLIKTVYEALYSATQETKTESRPISVRETEPKEAPATETRDGKLVIPSDTTSLVQALQKQFLMKDLKTGETTSAFIWFRDMGIISSTGKRTNVSVMIQMVNAFIEEEQRGSRVWDPDKTPQELQKFVRERMGGREGEYRIF